MAVDHRTRALVGNQPKGLAYMDLDREQTKVLDHQVRLVVERQIKTYNPRLPLDAQLKELARNCYLQGMLDGQQLRLVDSAPVPQDLGNLLARIHRDGGHYVAEHGLAKALEDAEAKVVQWLARDDAGVEVGSCTYPDCACIPSGDVGCTNPNPAARGLSGGPQK